MSTDARRTDSPASPRVVLQRDRHPLATIVVLAWRNTRVVEALASVAEHCADVPHEVVVVLNGADEQVTDALAERVEGAIVLTSETNLGFGGGCNAAAAQASGDYVVFLNDDAVVRPGWLSSLLRAAQSEVGVGAVGSRMMFPDGRLQEAGCVLWSNGGTWQVGYGARDVDDLWRWRRDVIYSSAAGMLVERAAFLRLGGFDEAFYPAYFEDVDLCLRLREAGLRVLYEPDAEVVHSQSQSSHAYYRSFLYARNLATLRARWADVLQVLPHEPVDHSLEVMYAAAGRAEDAFLTATSRPAVSARQPAATQAALSGGKATGGEEPSAGRGATQRSTARLVRSERATAERAAVELPPERATDPASTPGQRGRESRRVDSTLARMHQMRTEAGVARAYIEHLEQRLLDADAERDQLQSVRRLQADEIAWLRERITAHEAHEVVLLERLEQLQDGVDGRDRRLAEVDAELSRLHELEYRVTHQALFRLAAVVNDRLRAHPWLASRIRPVGHWLARRAGLRS